MKKILTEKKYRMNLSEFKQRKQYISRLLSHLNNEVLDCDLSPNDRSKLYNALIQGLKTMNELCRDSTLEELEARVSALEEARKEKQ